jgi:iron complex outermembrane receptor protein
VGLYLQDQVKFFNRLTLTVGGRVDFSSNDGDSTDAFSPRVGLTYEFIPGAALYANYSESFNPQWFSTTAAGKPVAPETGENFEIGLKTALLDGRLDTLLALYQLTRQNVATANLSTTDPFDSITSGEQRSRGVEFEAALQLLPGWDLTTAYTYNDAEITKDNTLPVGARLQGVPEFAFSAWTKYVLQDGLFRGLGFGLGGRYYTDQEGDATYSNPFKLPAFGIMDAAVYYTRDRFHAQVNINNVLDERHFVGSYNDLYVLPGEPLTVRATLGWAF